MKNITLLTAATLFACDIFAQNAVQDSVEMGAMYANEIYYTLDDGSEETAPLDNWDIAFQTGGGFSSAIRINGQAGTELYVYPGDTADWAALDTTGIASWEQLYDSEEEWSRGAFDNAADPNDQFDLGWGYYLLNGGHITVGHRLFVIQLSDDSYQKIWIKSLIGGVYTFQHASLDNAMDMTHTIDKADFDGKKFGYFSLQTHSELDREPMASDWDMVFTQYVAEFGTSGKQTVTGVLLNDSVYAAEARGVAITQASYTDYESDSLINTVGYDWKDLDYSGFPPSWVLEDDLSYFIYDRIGNIWHVAFTGFAGQSSGKVWFSKTLVSSVGIAETASEINIGIFPNPVADGNINLVFNLEEDEAVAQVFDMTGKLISSQVFQGQGFKERNLQLENAYPGTYILRLATETTLTTKKLIIR